MLRHNTTLRRKVRANQPEPQGKYLKYAQCIEQESLAEKMARFFKSIEDAYKQPNQNQVSETYEQAPRQQTDDQINTHDFVYSRATSDDAAYHAKIDYHFARLESICQQLQLQPSQQMTYTPTNYPSPYCAACSGYGYSHVSYNYGVYYCVYYGMYQGETGNHYNHTDYYNQDVQQM